MLLSVIEVIDILKNKEKFSEDNDFSCKIRRMIMSVIYYIIFLVLSLKFRKCYFADDKIHLLGAIFFPQLYVLFIIFTGRVCANLKAEVEN